MFNLGAAILVERARLEPFGDGLDDGDEEVSALLMRGSHPPSDRVKGGRGLGFACAVDGRIVVGGLVVIVTTVRIVVSTTMTHDFIANLGRRLLAALGVGPFFDVGNFPTSLQFGTHGSDRFVI